MIEERNVDCDEIIVRDMEPGILYKSGPIDSNADTSFFAVTKDLFYAVIAWSNSDTTYRFDEFLLSIDIDIVRDMSMYEGYIKITETMQISVLNAYEVEIKTFEDMLQKMQISVSQRLYTPLYFYLWDNDKAEIYRDSSNEERRAALPHEDALKYLDQIQQFIQSELDPEYGVQIAGLNSYNIKLKSVIPSIELYGDKLWLATEIRPEGYLSDNQWDVVMTEWMRELYQGWGSKMNQTAFEVDQGQLFIHPYDSPVQTEPHFLKEQELLERLKEGYAVYMDSLTSMGRWDIIHKAEEIRLTTDAYKYFSKAYPFDSLELDFLLQFSNPLDVIRDAQAKINRDWRAAADFPIRGVFVNLEDFVPVKSEMEDISSLKHIFDSILDRALADYYKTLMYLPVQDIVKYTDEIAARRSAAEYFSQHYNFTEAELRFLINRDNTLDCITNEWNLMSIDNADALVHDFPLVVFDEADALSKYPLIEDDASRGAEQDKCTEEKPSVRKKLQAAIRDQKQSDTNHKGKGKSGHER